MFVSSVPKSKLKSFFLYVLTDMVLEPQGWFGDGLNCGQGWSGDQGWSGVVHCQALHREFLFAGLSFNFLLSLSWLEL